MATTEPEEMRNSKNVINKEINIQNPYINYQNALFYHCILGVNFSRRHLEIFFSDFSYKIGSDTLFLFA